ncbi:DNA-binding protein, partial [archaeon]|nr:DNA-binding protein [archaeon]
QGIFFDGQVFDAYTFVSKLIKSASKSIVLIDNYVDESVLVMLSKRKEKVSCDIYTKNISDKLKLDLEKHNLQYPTVKLYEFKKSHDRFIIIDNKEVYHIGASLKDLGKKWFAFSKFEKSSIEILKKLEK